MPEVRVLIGGQAGALRVADRVVHGLVGGEYKPAPVATQPDPGTPSSTITALAGTPNTIRRIAVAWSAPTAGRVRVTRTYEGGSRTFDTDAVNGQSAAGVEMYDAYPPAAADVTVDVAVIDPSTGEAGTASRVVIPLGSPIAPNPVPARRTDLTRDPRFQPFTSTSPWNLPLPVSPTFEPVDSPATVSLRKERAGANNGGFHASQASDSHPINHALDTDPVVTATDTVSSSRSGSFRAPLGTVVSDDTATDYHDRHSHVVAPSGLVIDENYQVRRYTQARWDVSRHHTVDLTGDGLGPVNGTRAYGGSAVGGLIRAHEVEAKVIPHVVAWLMRADQLLRLTNPGGNYGYYTSGTFTTRDRSVADWCPDGWPLGTPRAGFSKGRGYQWPATEQDYAVDNFKGSLPYGALFGIPGDVDLNSLGLITEAGMILAVAMQTYGGMLSDQGGDAGVQVEPTAPTWFRAQLIDSFRSTDIRTIIQACRVVTGNSPSTPGGQPLDAPRRAPLLPEIASTAPVVDQAARVTASSPVSGNEHYHGGQTNASSMDTRYRHTLMDDATGFRLVHGNYRDNDRTTGNAIIVTAGLELGGSPVRVTWGGAPSVTIEQGGTVMSDPINVPRAKGDLIYSRTRVVPATAGGAVPRGKRTHNSRGEGSVRDSATDLTLSGTITPEYFIAGYGPTYIQATAATDQRMVLLVGDSIVTAGIGPNPSYAATALAAATVPHATVSWPGEQALQFAADANSRWRRRLSDAARDVVVTYGINDLGGTSTPPTWQTVARNLLTIWGYFPAARVWQTTITPKSTSTDSWATVGSQAPFGNETNRLGLNAWLRAGSPVVNASPVAPGTSGALLAGQPGHRSAGYIEVADAVESARDSGRWKAAATTDGLHPSGDGNALMRDAFATAITRFAVGGDTTAPTTSVDSPAAGSTTERTVTVNGRYVDGS